MSKTFILVRQLPKADGFVPEFEYDVYYDLEEPNIKEPDYVVARGTFDDMLDQLNTLNEKKMST